MQENFAKYLMQLVPQWIQCGVIHTHETVLYVYPDDVVPLLRVLRDHMNTQYRVLVDVTAVDYPSRQHRFEVVYNLLSVSHNARLRIKTCIDDTTSLESSTPIYSSAGWWEREVWDMFGIFFSGHPDLRRILTDYGFEGHPLRKDFPLTGYVEVRYDDSEKRVVTESLECTQEYRTFDFASPWEQIETTKA